MLFKSFISAALFAVAAVAKIQFTSVPTTGVEVGTSYIITWTGGDAGSPATIILRKGNSQALDTVETLTTNAVGGSFSWTPEKTLTDGSDYALQIVQGSDNNYSLQFPVAGGSGTAKASGSASAKASASASASGSITSVAAAVSSSFSSGASSNSTAASSSSASASSAAESSSNAAQSSALTSTRPTAATTSVPASGASGLQSPIAFIMCAVAAMLYLN